jgi:hypothetical protein
MDLEKLQQELEALQQIDTTNLTPEQLTELVNRLSTILDRSEHSLLETSLIELNKTEDENETDNS